MNKIHSSFLISYIESFVCAAEVWPSAVSHLAKTSFINLAILVRKYFNPLPFLNVWQHLELILSSLSCTEFPLPVLNVWQYLELILLSLSCTECCHYVGLVHHQVLSVSSRISSFLVFG